MPKNKILYPGDYFLAGFIGFCVSVFLIPISKNIFSWENDSYSLLNLLIFSLLLIGLSIIGLFIAGIIAKKIPVILQLAKFILVGGFNTLLDWSIVNLLMLLTVIFNGVWFVLFNIISFTVANIASFFWNKYWTFSSKDKQINKDLFQFFIVSVLGLIIKAGVAHLVVDIVGPLGNISPKIWSNIGLFFATSFSMIWNFLGYKFIVFKK